MQEQDVPQDNISTYSGLRKLLYALDEQGNYTSVPSNGWEVEQLVNGMAVEELEELASEALERFKQSKASPLEYYMYRCRLDLPQLAQATGFFQWRIRRHMRADIWPRLNDKILARYSDVLGLDIHTLKNSLL